MQAQVDGLMGTNIWNGILRRYSSTTMKLNCVSHSHEAVSKDLALIRRFVSRFMPLEQRTFSFMVVGRQAISQNFEKHGDIRQDLFNFFLLLKKECYGLRPQIEFSKCDTECSFSNL